MPDRSIDKKLAGSKSVGVTDSELNMWRAIFACAHADDVVTQEERRFLRKALNSEPFSDAQRAVLEQDIEVKQEIGAMFKLITDQKDRSKFFYFARMLFWCDGDFAEQEQKILTALAKEHFDTVKVEEISRAAKFELEAMEDHVAKPASSQGWSPDDLHLKTTGLQLEETQKEWIQKDMQAEDKKKWRLAGIMDRFRDRYG